MIDEEDDKEEMFAFKPEDERLADELRHLIWDVLRRSPFGPRELCGIRQLLHQQTNQ